MPEAGAPRRRTTRAAIGLVAVAVAAAAVVSLTACSGSEGTASPAPDREQGTADGAPEIEPAAALCAARLRPGGQVASPALVETSGLVASRSHPDVLWAHNDSGSGPEVYALGLDGADLGTVEVTGAGSVDWEDIALAAGTAGAPDRLVIADIGDNPGGGARVESPARLWVVDEPAPPGPAGTGSSEPAIGVAVGYADGARDAEAVVADPTSGDVFVISKQWDGTAAGVYRVPAASLSGGAQGTVVMEREASVAGTDGALVTGADVSADGRVVVLRTYDGVRIWDRPPGTTVPEALIGEPRCILPVLERQGESVAVLADGSGFVTVSEGQGVDVKVHRDR